MIYRLNRRNFLVLAAGILGLFSPMSSNSAKLLGKKYQDDPLIKIYAHDLLAAKTIGLRYLRNTQSEAKADLLAEIIVKRDPILGRRFHTLSSDQLIRILRKRIRQDFESGNVVHVDGWVLSRTEVRLCALCTFL